jgi:hypothetical protein
VIPRRRNLVVKRGLSRYDRYDRWVVRGERTRHDRQIVSLSRRPSTLAKARFYRSPVRAWVLRRMIPSRKAMGLVDGLRGDYQRHIGLFERFGDGRRRLSVSYQHIEFVHRGNLDERHSVELR